MNAERLTLDEKIEIILIVGEHTRSSREAAREFNRRHPQRPRVHHGTVARICNLFRATGSVVKPRNNINRRHEDEHVILDSIRANPRTSLRHMAQRLNISVSKIYRTLKRHKLKAFKPKFLHTLEEGDTILRLEYCFWMQGNFLNDRDFLKKIIFSDEATFTTNGVVSSQNSRYWSVENPNWTINCKRQYSQKVNVWCGLYNQTVIGPYFFFDNMNSASYLNFLNTTFWNFIENLPLKDRMDLYFQQDGAPIHSTRPVRAWLNENFPHRWIGRFSPLILWPPRSPDLNPLDFYFWGHIKNKVYSTRPQNREQLCERIREVCREITPQELTKVMQHNRRRIEKCIRVNGQLIKTGPI